MAYIPVYFAKCKFKVIIKVKFKKKIYPYVFFWHNLSTYQRKHILKMKKASFINKKDVKNFKDLI